MDDKSRAILAKAGAGSPGQALEYLGLDMEAIEGDMAAIVESGDPSNAIRSAMAHKLSLKAAQRRYEAFLRRAPQLIVEYARGQDARFGASVTRCVGECECSGCARRCANAGQAKCCFANGKLAGIAANA